MMRHKYLPRAGAVVLGLGGALLALGAACADSTGPGTTPPAAESRLVLTVSTGAGDSVPQLAVDVTAALRDSAPIGALRVYVDSATRPSAQALDFDDAFDPAWRRRVVAYAPGPGPHKITVAVDDSAGRTVSASVTRTFSVPDVAYTATVLPDQGYGAEALHLNATNEVVGWVGTATRNRRPARWSAGALRLLPTAGGESAEAVRINGAGDVLLQVVDSTYLQNPGFAFETAMQVVRRDGSVVALTGGGRYVFPDGPPGQAPSYQVVQCCSTAADLSETGVALGNVSGPVDFKASARFDVATGRVLDTVGAYYSRLNSAGRMAGSFLTYTGRGNTTFNTFDLTVPPLPTGSAALCTADYCNHSGSAGSIDLVDLDEGSNLLVEANRYYDFAYLSSAGSVWLDRYVGRTSSAHLSRQGGRVAALDSAGTVYVWNAADHRAARVRFAGSAWRVDAISAVNAAGAVAAHGTDPATGRAAALLLTPAAAAAPAALR